MFMIYNWKNCDGHFAGMLAFVLVTNDCFCIRRTMYDTVLDKNISIKI